MWRVTEEKKCIAVQVGEEVRRNSYPIGAPASVVTSSLASLVAGSGGCHVPHGGTGGIGVMFVGAARSRCACCGQFDDTGGIVVGWRRR